MRLCANSESGLSCSQGIQDYNDVKAFLQKGTRWRADVAERGEDHRDSGEAHADLDALHRHAHDAATQAYRSCHTEDISGEQHGIGCGSRRV